MALSDRLEDLQQIVHGGVCAYQAMVDSMPKEEQETLAAAWSKGYSQRIILRALRSEGYKTSNESIMGHRTGNCKCQK